MAPGAGNDTTTQGAPNMSSNRLRLLLVSMMAVFAISAVASASASAAATCYPVAEPKTGNFETSPKCEKHEETPKSEWVAIEKLEKEVKPGEWCAKVKVAGTGNYETLATCVAGTPKVATGAFIRVKVSQDIWQVCQEGGTEKFEEHKCSKKSETGKWSWLPITGGEIVEGKETHHFKVESSGGTFTLTAGGKTVTCKKVTDKGTIESAGADKATEIKFEECSTGTAGCEVENKGGTLKTVVVSEIPTQLEQVVIGEEEILVDKFSQKTVGTTKEFVTLVFSGTSCSAAGYVETKVKGDVAAEVKNEANGEVKLTFPSTPIAQTPKLEAFGVAATLTGSDNEALVNGWAFRGV
jgi:hypothetical protein